MNKLIYIFTLVASFLGLSSGMVGIIYYYVHKKALDELNIYYNKDSIVFMYFVTIIFTIIFIYALIRFVKITKLKQ